jgi:hypothetical protein
MSRFLTLELPYLPGGTLADVQKQLREQVAARELSDAERVIRLCQLWHELCETLIFVHAAGVAHRGAASNGPTRRVGCWGSPWLLASAARLCCSPRLASPRLG